MDVQRLWIAIPLALTIGCAREDSPEEGAADGITFGPTSDSDDASESVDTGNDTTGAKLDLSGDEGMSEAGDELGDGCAGLMPPATRT
jgi:hypothetical protein